MMALPQKMAFDGLKAGLSSVNNEFNRLSQITGIGLGAAALWQQRSFAAQLELLAKNARWWEQFRLLDIEFHEDRFRNEPDYLRGFVSLLLAKTNCDLAEALVFCDDYQLEGLLMFQCHSVKVPPLYDCLTSNYRRLGLC